MDMMTNAMAQANAAVNDAVNDMTDLVMGKQAGPLDPLMQAIGNHNEIYITQSVAWAEALTGGLCEQANKYAVSGPGGGEDPTNGPLLLIAKERGNCLHRILCAPQNGQFIDLFPVQGNYSAHQIKDYVAKVNLPSEHDGLMANPPLISMERPGCCQGNNCLCCPAVCDPCTDRMTLHRGYVKGDPGAVEKANPVLFLKQTPGMGGAMLAPEIVAMTDEDGTNGQQVKISGPMCFGGCSEFCMDAPFVAKDANGNMIGEIRKMRPQNCTELMTEIFTDSDRFKLTFNPNATPEAKAAMLSSAFLLDLMYFETDISCCKYSSSKGLQFNCINCYCCGCLIPCTCGTGGGGGGGESSE